METKPVVLGSDLAAAHEAENARLAFGVPGPSPLSGRRYDPEAEEFNLMAVVQAPLDRDVERLVTVWQDSGAEEREKLRRSLSLADNYTLIQFAKRMAVVALNVPAPDPCEKGLMALAMIDERRIDPRDASWAAGLLSHAVRASSGRSATLFEQVIAVATPGMGELLRGAQGSTLEDWGYREWRTGKGTGLIHSGWARYDPTVDLVDIAALVGEQILSERYVFYLEVATELPSVWFDKPKRSQAEEALGRSLGTVMISGTLRRAFGGSAVQMFWTWIVEMPTPEDCVQLVADVGSGAHMGGRSVVGVAARRLFALLVAGSVQESVSPIESPATLTDLADRTRMLLSRR